MANNKAAIIGAGVVGAGWAARFSLHGWNVTVYDPSESARRGVTDVVRRARSCLEDLYDQPLGETGELTLTDDLRQAVNGADWLQESVPEQLTAKRDLFAALADSIPPETPLASSTSGFKPSVLADGLPCADQLLVCHPFQPVYLLPAVEVVPGEATRPAITERAIEVLVNIGMSPLLLEKEIDAHIADRLLEAIWREALWLVKDDIATTGQIDSVIRNGFGLRWAQMGLFETYRIAGGESGMRHFLAQFGPALQWPWSRLTDVPELDDALIEKIAAQSDAQAASVPVDEMTEQRDRNLVAVLKALKGSDAGAGKILNTFERGR